MTREEGRTVPTIRKLSNELIGRIAAGEVVERPASAVKELVENSIDAGAGNITVELRDGGISYLRVSDNGCGIPGDQTRMAFERHATSKLKSADELFDMHTLGFRGEALASIAAVSKATLVTRVKDAAYGTRTTVEGGAFGDIVEAASPVGTSITVENLFFNAPVRLKFLKKPAMEAALVADYMLRLILSRPDIAFRFVSQGKTVYRSVGDGKIESALLSIYGREALSDMRRISGHMNGVVAEGYVGVGELARGNRQQQSFFVNGRYFRSAALGKALENGCEGRIMVGRFPMCAIYLQLPYNQVDVNVHPNKLEVRFRDEAAVAQAVEELTRDAFRGESLGEALRGGHESAAAVASDDRRAPEAEITRLGADEPSSNVTEEKPDALSHLKPIVLPSVSSAPQTLHEVVMPTSRADALLTRQSAAYASAPAASKAREPVPEPVREQTRIAETEKAAADEPRLIGVAFDTYWIFEAGERLLLVDQHAAHERMLYDDMMKRRAAGNASQRLLSPLLMRLTAGDMALALEYRDVLSDAGFDIEPFDVGSVAIRAIPTIFGHNGDARELLSEALDELHSGRGEAMGERVRKRVAQMACKRAIKGGDRLNEAELQGFLKKMQKSGSMPTCPHGRPIVIEVTRYALEKRFKRV